jgi:hypothetical protein
MGLSLPLSLEVNCSLNVEFNAGYGMTTTLRDLRLSEVSLQPISLDTVDIGLGPT